MLLLVVGVVLFVLLGVAFAWRLKMATHYRGPGMKPSHQSFTEEHEYHHHHQITVIPHDIHQGQVTQNQTSPTTPSTHNHN